MAYGRKHVTCQTSAIYIGAAFIIWNHLLVQSAAVAVASANAAETCYDFIVVGAGAAGSVVARRLSEQYRVLLLEWGGEPDPDMYVPALTRNFLNDEFTHAYHTVPQKNAGLRNNGRILLWTGKTLGGGTAINGMTFQRGNPKNYDKWADITGDPSWKYQEMLKYLKKIEDYQGGWPLGEYHAKGGPITVSRPKFAPGLDTWMEAGKSLGYPVADPNAIQTTGFIPIEYSMSHGHRMTSYRGYVEPVLGQSSNLTLIQNVKVNKILFQGNKAVGVQYITKDGEKVAVCQSKEVIISAGVYSSPVVLMKSGIGPKKVLEDAGIAPVKHLPVGRNLHDHPLVPVNMLMRKDKIELFDRDQDLNPATLKEYKDAGEGPYSSFNGKSAQAFLVSSVRAKEESQKNGLWPDLQLLLMQTPFGIVGSDNNEAKTDDEDEISIAVNIFLTRPKSRSGTINLNKMDVEQDPLIDMQYFSHPDDMEAMIDGIQQVLNLFENTTAYQEQGAHYLTEPLEFCENFDFRSRGYWKCYIKYIARSGNHAGGTCRMGKGEDDPDAVVDSKLSVIGIENVRVADCSIMPEVTNGNTQVPGMVIGEKAAAEILEYWSGYIDTR